MEHETTGRRRESDRLLGELRRQLRAELMHEFLIKDGGQGQPSTRLPVATVGLDATARTFEDLRTPLNHEDLVCQLIAVPQQICKPFRFCVDPADAENVDILGVRIGTVPCFLSGVPVPATAFPPLPAWMLEPDGIEGTIAIAAVRDAPIENLGRLVTANPGVQISVEYRYRDREQLAKRWAHGLHPLKPLRAWVLAYMPNYDAAE